jgi:uncharacterized membrane protein SirB2
MTYVCRLMAAVTSSNSADTTVVVAVSNAISTYSVGVGVGILSLPGILLFAKCHCWMVNRLVPLSVCCAVAGVMFDQILSHLSGGSSSIMILTCRRLFDMIGNVKLCRICQTIYSTKRSVKRACYFHTGGMLLFYQPLTYLPTSLPSYNCCRYYLPIESRKATTHYLSVI